MLIIGTGMLGKELKEMLPRATAWDKEHDITNKQIIQDILDLKPSLIINCAAYTAVDKAEEEQEICYKINVTGVENLTEAAKQLDIPIISISTDYVFDGKKQSYNEDDKRNAINYYGKTKQLGEEILEKYNKHYIIRTSWLFGKYGNNFVETMFKLSQQPEIKVVNTQFGKPTYAKDLAKAILSITKHPYGIYHITNEGSCSWFEFAIEILKDSECKVILCTEYPTKAKRPNYSILNNNKLEKQRHWKEALDEYKKNRN